MLKISEVRTILSEYGVGWAINRLLYALKLRSLCSFPMFEKVFEKRANYPQRVDIFDIDISSLEDFLEKNLDSKEKEVLVVRADEACQGIITGFSSVRLNYGNPINWQLNPITGKCCSEDEKWFKIADFDVNRGDIKVIWEASRFSHFITLARAYILTKDEKYYKAFSVQMKDWLVHNRYGYGANFKCGQECSFRMVNALLAYSVFRGFGVTNDDDENNVKELIDRCYRKVLSNFFYAYRCIKNNHTISELMGMIVGAWCCKDERQLEKAYRFLDEVIDEQFAADGGYKQFSFNYHRLVLQDLECIISISEKTGKKLNQRSLDKIKKSAILMFQCQDASGDMPNYGSNDGALIFPMASCDYRDFRPTINAMYALTEGKQLYGRGKHCEELLWFSKGRTLEEYETAEIKRESSSFEDAGIFTLRGSRFWAMLVANDYHSRPAHMDQNHFDMWSEGRNIFCDAGTYSYASEQGRALVENQNHNTALIPGKKQMSSRGPFLIYDWTRREILGITGDSLEISIASANGYKHKRKIEMKSDGYIVKDWTDQDFQVIFHTPYTADVEKNTVKIKDGSRLLCELTSTGTIELEEAKRSLYYLKMEPAYRIKINGKGGEEIKTEIKIKEYLE